LILNVEIENRVKSNQFDFKIVEIELNFRSIPNVEIVESSWFQKLKSKLDPTISLNIIYCLKYNKR